MPTFDVDRKSINVFEINDTYAFKQFFDQDDLFTQLEQYYNENAYRFELPTKADLNQVDDLLDGYFYDLHVVDNQAPFCVVIDRDKDHSDILRNAVVRYQRGDHYIFLMKDQLSVDQAVEHGATKLRETDLPLPW